MGVTARKWVIYGGSFLLLLLGLLVAGALIDRKDRNARFSSWGIFITGEDDHHYAALESSVACFDREGHRLWLTELDPAAGEVFGLAAAPDGNVYIGTWDGWLFSLDPGGKQRWARAHYEQPSALEIEECHRLAVCGQPVVLDDDRILLVRNTEFGLGSSYSLDGIYDGDGELLADLGELNIDIHGFDLTYTGMCGGFWQRYGDDLYFAGREGIVRIGPDNAVEIVARREEGHYYSALPAGWCDTDHGLWLVDSSNSSGSELCEYDPESGDITSLLSTRYEFLWTVDAADGAVLGHCRRQECWRDGKLAWELPGTFKRCAPVPTVDGGIQLVEGKARRFLPNNYNWLVVDAGGEVVKRQRLPVRGNRGIFRFDGPGRLLFCDSHFEMQVFELE